MSDQQQAGPGVILDLEELFLSREFGRRPARSIRSASAAVVSEPAHLEQVFLSEVFGHPEVLAGATQAVGVAARASARPTLVLLHGGGEGSSSHDTRTRAIAAFSGVAAAALAVAGLASGTGSQGSGRPPVTEQAQGRSGPVGGSQPGPAAPAVPSGSASTGPSAARGTNAALTSFAPPVAAVVPSAPTGLRAPPPPVAPAPSSGGPTPGSPPGIGGGGGGGMLTPVVNAVGNEVSSVTATSGNLGQAVGQALGTVGTSATNNVGGGSPPNIFGAV